MLHKEINPIVLVGGARPNFMKIVPLARVLIERDIPFYVVNAGQHFSKEMSQDFFLEFNLSIDFELKPSTDKNQQDIDIFNGLNDIFRDNAPALLVVVGDVDATLHAARAANARGIPVAHVEAGLRSNNWKMREETNRRETDSIATLKFAPSEGAAENLYNEAKTAYGKRMAEGVEVVGNIMIDLLKLHESAVKDTAEPFYFATMHRAENVDDKHIFEQILSALEEISKDAPIYLPLHPRTKKKAEEFGLLERLEKACHVLPALSYVESVYYQKNARLVLTDSGGVQEETSVLGTPCITMRTETERPVTVSHGTNVVAGVTTEGILKAYRATNFTKRPAHIPLWDGKTAERIIDSIEAYVRH